MGQTGIFTFIHWSRSKNHPSDGSGSDFLIPVQLIHGSTPNLLNEKNDGYFFPTKQNMINSPPDLLNENNIFPQQFISWIFVWDVFFPKQKPKKTIRFQKPSKPRPLVTSHRVELSSWHILEEQFVALPRPPSLSRGFEKFYNKVVPGSRNEGWESAK